MNKDQQKKLLIEVMEADEKDGLYKTNNMAQQTAVEWLIEQLRQLAHNPETRGQEWGEAFEQAKQMEKEQMFEYIKKLYVNGDASREFHKKEFEQYYNETYGK